MVKVFDKYWDNLTEEEKHLEIDDVIVCKKIIGNAIGTTHLEGFLVAVFHRSGIRFKAVFYEKELAVNYAQDWN